MFANVIIEYPIKDLDKTFTYKIPNNLIDCIKVGMKVMVPFNNKSVNGFILEIIDNCNKDYELKSIISIIDSELKLTKELMDLGIYMSETILCTKISSYQAMLPSSFKIKKQKNNFDYYKKFIILNKSNEEIKSYILNHAKNKKQMEILKQLLTNKKIEKKNISGGSLNKLLGLFLVTEIHEQEYRINKENASEKMIILNEAQQQVLNNIYFSEYKTYLLYGVTGSGKTEIYLNAIETVLKNNQTAIMLVPEISLTMQIVNRFYNRFGSKVAVLHSALSDGEKHDEYLKIMRGEVSVVVGTRSAIFAPLKNLGIIIIDEEHSDTYKQDNYPRYDAKKIADYRAKYNNIPLILGSATPSLDSMARAQKKVFTLLELKSRVGESSLPKISLINMDEEYKKRNFIFSEELTNKINERLNNQEQVILLLNRRGFSTFISCSNCGYTYKCPNCDISLTYHKTSNNLVCHYCGYQIKCDKLCPKCHEDGLKYMGLGTEKLEEEINNKFIGAKVIRMDQDTTSRKGAHEKIIEAFKNNQYNILLGTSMISKGLDFPNVTLVGVINADTSLNIPDYKSNENTFSLLSQVSGRAGRRKKIGEVIIQTFNPDNSVLKCVKNNSYDDFYRQEMIFRRNLKYPPYYYLIGIKVTSKDYNEALQNAKIVTDFLKNHLNKETLVLGPTTAAILRFNNIYRFQIIIKYRFDDLLIETLRNVDSIINNKNNVNIEIDFNPNRI